MQFFAYTGYDRSVSMFSPDGSIVQVEYALNAISKAKLSMILKTNEGIIFGGFKERTLKLISKNHIEKIFEIDDHIAAIIVGFLPDGKILIEQARDIAISHRILYDEPATLEIIMKEISKTIQSYTQFGGARPFGVNLMIGSIEEGRTRAMVIGPPGEYYEVYAWAAGSGYSEVLEFLEETYKEDIDLETGYKLFFEAIQKIKKKPKPYELEIGELRVDKKLKIFNQEEISELINKYIGEEE